MGLWFVVSMLLAQLPPLGPAANGTIRGAVRFTDGKPAGGIRVAAMLVPESGVDLRGLSILSVLTENQSDGVYCLGNVPAGQYYIVAGRVDSPTYHPGTMTPSAARTVTVAAGAAVDGIDIVISPERAARPPAPPTLRFPQTLRSPLNLPLVRPFQSVNGRIALDEGSRAAKLPDQIVLDAGPRGVRTPV